MFIFNDKNTRMTPLTSFFKVSIATLNKYQLGMMQVSYEKIGIVFGGIFLQIKLTAKSRTESSQKRSIKAMIKAINYFRKKAS